MLDQINNIFLVGIKGVAMTNLAVILKKMGKSVTGSDIKDTFLTDDILASNEISILTDFAPEELPPSTQLVVYSASHMGINNPQVMEANRRSIQVVSQADLLGQIMDKFQTSIAACGCHGKTTAAAMMAYALKQLDEQPSYIVGATNFDDMPGGIFDKEKFFVIEADEYGISPPIDKTPKFHFLHPKMCLCTNIDFDHPDVYANINETSQAFLKFFRDIIRDSTEHKLFFCADDKPLMEVAAHLPRESYLTYGYNKEADLHIRNPIFEEEFTQFDLVYNKKPLERFTISLFGEKNISNAAGVVLTLLHLGYSEDRIRHAISGFSGVKRRFEKVAYTNHTYLFDDYAHHPEEIKATIQAARRRFTSRRIIAIFQPHTYSRTYELQNEFVDALSLADYSLIAPIFSSAREKGETINITSIDLENIAKNKGIMHIKAYTSVLDIIDTLREMIKPGDVVFTMGAGDIYKLKNDIIEVLKIVE